MWLINISGVSHVDNRSHAHRIRVWERQQYHVGHIHMNTSWPLFFTVCAVYADCIFRKRITYVK